MARRGRTGSPPSTASPRSRRAATRGRLATRAHEGPGRLAWLAFAVIAAVAVALLAGLALTTLAARDWAAGITIEEERVSRAEVRATAEILDALALVRAAEVDRLWVSGQVTAAERAALDAAVAASDPLAATVDQLVRDHAVRNAAREAGITAGSVDAWMELAAAAVEPVERHVRFVALSGPSDVGPAPAVPQGWEPIPPGVSTDPRVLEVRDRAAAHVAQAIAVTPADELVAAATAAGWTAVGRDTWIAARGADPVVPPTLLARLRAPGLAPGTVTGPFLDEASGDVVVGALIARGPGPDVERTRDDLAAAAIDESALGRWAEGRVLERALEAAMTEAWTRTPSMVTMGSEVVIAVADLAGAVGPYAGLAHLVVDELPPGELPPAEPHPIRTVGSPAGVLADALRAMPTADRIARFDALVEAANADDPADPARVSGELGWYGPTALLPVVGGPATGPAAYPGLVIGPVTTTVGTELFLVRGTYSGVLDERAAALLLEAGTTADLEAVARRIAPGAAFLRFHPGVLRSELEVLGDDEARSALLDTPVGSASGPFSLGGELLMVIPRERREEVPTGQALERIGVGSFEAWLAEQAADLAVVVDDNPFGLAEAPAVTPGDASAPAVPTVEPMATPPEIILPGSTGS